MKMYMMIILLASFLSSSVVLADECIEGDCVNGYGTLLTTTGQKFIGHFKDGMRHGKGVFILPGGRKLEGTWQDNEIVEGTYTNPDGTRYVGQWKYRERNGHGELTFPDGRRYVGEFKSGQRHGQGTMWYPDGRKYAGDFQFGERTGQGTMTYPDGREYTGGFQNGERSGQGTLTYPDGKTLSGEFKYGEFVGDN
ncbi:MAG: 2-isopropylmalate synthase [Desulfobacterales bacterium]|jgi:hypothetical protein